MSVIFTHKQMHSSLSHPLFLLRNTPTYPHPHRHVTLAQNVAIPPVLSLHNSGLTHCSSGLFYLSHLKGELKSSPRLYFCSTFFQFSNCTSSSFYALLGLQHPFLNYFKTDGILHSCFHAIDIFASSISL